MLVKFARNWFSPRGELFYTTRNPNVVDDSFHDSLPPDAVVVEGPDRPKPDTTKPDEVPAAPTPDAESKKKEAAALDAASKAPEPSTSILAAPPPASKDAKADAAASKK